MIVNMRAIYAPYHWFLSVEMLNRYTTSGTTTKDSKIQYTISSISLEFDTVINASLASQIRTEYMKSSILYDRILRAHIIQLNNSGTSFSLDINSPSKSLKGVLLTFTKERSATKSTCDTEEFFNPKITKVEVTTEGVPNDLYTQNMEYRH